MKVTKKKICQTTVLSIYAMHDSFPFLFCIKSYLNERFENDWRTIRKRGEEGRLRTVRYWWKARTEIMKGSRKMMKDMKQWKQFFCTKQNDKMTRRPSTRKTLDMKVFNCINRKRRRSNAEKHAEKHWTPSPPWLTIWEQEDLIVQKIWLRMRDCCQRNQNERRRYVYLRTKYGRRIRKIAGTTLLVRHQWTNVSVIMK